MSFGSAAAVQADVLFRANTAAFSGDMQTIRQEAERTFGALDATTLKAALASEKYDRALARSKGSTFAVAKATAAYKAELAALEHTETRAAGSAGRHSNALRHEERSLGQMARGAAVGSGALGHLGRAAVFASSSLLGGYGLVYALRSVITAARDHQVAVGHVDVALQNSGLSWSRYGGQIKDALDQQVKLTGFTDNELTDSLAGFIRRFGDVNKALQANATAADVARAQNISLADAARLVQRASFGNPRSLRILGIELTKVTANTDALKASTKHATAEQIANAKAADLQATKAAALDAVQRKFHGNSAKFLQTDRGKQQLFNAELEKTKEIIGARLLPVFDHYLVSLTTWLEKMNRSGKLQRDVNKYVHDGAVVLHDAGEAAKFTTKHLGGLKNTLELLLALKTASTVTGWASSIGLLGTKARVSKGEVRSLEGVLTRLAAIGVITIGVEILIHRKQIDSAVTGLLDRHRLSSISGSDNFKGLNAGNVDAAIAAARKAHDSFTVGILEQAKAKLDAAAAKQDGIDNFTVGDRQNPRANVPGSPGYVPPRSGTDTKPKHKPLVLGLNYDQQNQLLEAEATTSTADDVRVLDGQVAALDRALNQKGLTPQQRNQLLNERNQALSALQSIQQQQASARSAAAAKADAARRRAAAARRKQLLAETRIPAKLIAREARAETAGAPTSTILHLLALEKRALHREEAQLHRQGAGAEFDALIAKQEEAVQKHINRVIKQARKKRIGLLEAIPVELRLAEVNAKAHNASEERLLAIYKKEHAALEKQIATLKRIHASKEEILKARQREAAVQAKINAAQKQVTGDFGKLEREFLAGFAGIEKSYAPNVTVNQHFPHPPTDDGHREAVYARRAASAAFDG